MQVELVQDTVAAWPAQAIRDSVRAIVEDQAYDRQVTQTLWDHIAEAIGRALAAFFRLLPPLPGTRQLVIVLALVLVALVIARLWLNARARREYWAGERGASRGSAHADHWRDAERLAAAGSYLLAAHALCAALLAASARRGEVTLHHAKTTGDYQREMRRRGAPSERDFARFRSRYDRVVYDRQECGPDDYAALLVDARPLLTRERAA